MLNTLENASCVGGLQLFANYFFCCHQWITNLETMILTCPIVFCINLRESNFTKRKQNVAGVRCWPTVRLSSGESELARRSDSHNSTNLSPECLFGEARVGMEI